METPSTISISWSFVISKVSQMLVHDCLVRGQRNGTEWLHGSGSSADECEKMKKDEDLERKSAVKRALAEAVIKLHIF